jgi:hypothetical protein
MAGYFFLSVNDDIWRGWRLLSGEGLLSSCWQSVPMILCDRRAKMRSREGQMKRGGIASLRPPRRAFPSIQRSASFFPPRS